MDSSAKLINLRDRAIEIRARTSDSSAYTRERLRLGLHAIFDAFGKLLVSRHQLLECLLGISGIDANLEQQP